MKYDPLWNDLPKELRLKLMPHMIESHILHIEQCKLKAVSAHKAHMKEWNGHIKNLEKLINK